MPISRKYRPQLFKDVTGQQHITETLRKEVETGSLGHSFLFSGPRGVGKTTTARIFAKALLNESTDHGEPPLDSEASKQIDLGNCIDFLEIDAASNTGVDHVREVIIEHVRFAPARWKRKVYVIDECHMLSTSAWNALLKTLEEPPEYAFFILATTELHKVPETIKSRCQRFEFKRILPVALADRIELLAKAEGITIEEPVIRQIVHASDGCLRDAESLMEQLMSLGTTNITSDIASLVLPMSMLSDVSELFNKAISRNVSDALAFSKKLIAEGLSPLELIQDLLEVTRLLIRAQDLEEKKILEEGDDGDRAIAKLVGVCSLGELAEIALMLLERRRDIKVGTDPLFALELSICAIAGGLLPHAPTGDESRPFHSAPQFEPLPYDEKKAQTNTNDHKILDSKEQKTSAPPQPSQPIEPLPPISSLNTSNDVEIKPLEVEVKRETPAIKAFTPDIQIQNQQSNTIPTVATNDSQPAEQRLEDGFDIHDVRKYWSIIIREVEKENHSLPFILKICQPDHIEGSTIHIRFQYSFHREKLLDDMKSRRIVEGALRTILKNEKVLIDGFCQAKSDEDENSLNNAPADVVSRVLGAFGGQVIE